MRESASQSTPSREGYYAASAATTVWGDPRRSISRPLATFTVVAVAVALVAGSSDRLWRALDLLVTRGNGTTALPHLRGVYRVFSAKFIWGW